MSQIVDETQTVTAPRPRRRRRGVAVAAACVGVLAVGGGAVAVADGFSVWRSPGMVHIETQNLDVIYHGQRIDQDALQALNDQGRALFTATDVDTATDLNATRAFDTQAELDAYGKAYLAWQTDGRTGHVVKPWGRVAPQSWAPTSH